MLYLLELFFGLTLLVKSAHYLVDGASSIAKRFKISNLVIGLTVVAFGTSAPELVVNLISAYQDKALLSVGNILGSNIANIFLVLGLSAIIYPIRVKRHIVWKEIPLGILVTVVVAVLANDTLVDGRAVSHLTRSDGIALLGFFLIYLYYTYSLSLHQKREEDSVKLMSKMKSSIFITGGIIGLALGGEFVIDGAVALTSYLGFKESTVGLLVLAAGTSLPELATSIVASFRKHSNMAVGNIIGSNIFNLLWILGLGAIVKPIPFDMSVNFDFGVVIFANLVLFALAYFGRKRLSIERKEGVLLLFLYILYVINLLVR